MKYSSIVPRKTSSKQDPEAVKRYLNFYRQIENGPIPVWFFDETGVEANHKPARVLALRNTRPEAPYTGDHIRFSVMGAVNPRTGQFESLIMPYSDAQTYQEFLDYFNVALSGQYCFLIQDNATWHHVKTLNWGTVIPIYLPSYSPGLNAIEELWKVLKAKRPPLKRINSEEELQDITISHLRHFLDNPEEIKSICQISEPT